MDIIVFAGFYGGLRIRNGGFISFVERWRFGGRCDCGGWDIGCLLKVFKVRLRREERWYFFEVLVDCKLFDLFIEV